MWGTLGKCAPKAPQMLPKTHFGEVCPQGAPDASQNAPTMRIKLYRILMQLKQT